jgi:hypothetical protein
VYLVEGHADPPLPAPNDVTMLTLVADVTGTTEATQHPGGGFNSATNQRQRAERVSGAPHRLALVTYQPLHSASFGDPHVWLLSGWPWVAVPSLTFVVVLPVLAGHWLVVSLVDGLV